MARDVCCLVVAEGPDPTGAVAAAVPFHGSAPADASPGGGGSVSLSCSGVVVLGRRCSSRHETDVLVAAPLSLLSPFLLAGGGRGAVAAAIGGGGGGSSGRYGSGGPPSPLPPPGVALRVLLPPPPPSPGDCEGSTSSNVGRWEAARVAGVARLPACAAALRAALSRLRSAEPAAAWRLGWALGPTSAAASAADEAADEAAAFLVLRIGGGGGNGGGDGAPGARAPPPLCRCPSSSSPSCPPASLRPASPVAAWGAPFGALAPAHFAGSAVAGVVSGALPDPFPPPHSSSSAARGAPVAAAATVLRLDLAALPGMEGGPVACGACWRLAAVLSRPLARGGGGGGAVGAAEVPLAFSARLLLEACLPFSSSRGEQWKGEQDEEEEEHGGATARAAAAAAHAGAPPPVERALSRGVVMVRCGGAWATGVVMPRARQPGPVSNSPVLVLTIAHLFDQAARGCAGGAVAGAAGGGAATAEAAAAAAARVRVTCPRTGRHAWSAPALLLHRFRSPHLDLAVLAVPYPSERRREGRGREEEAELGGSEAAAALRVGLDALLPLELLSSSSPSPPSLGPLPVVVAGHGLFGPALGWPAAATAGSLARVVLAAPVPAAEGAPPSAVMALTTAAVHAGASGAAVLCARTGRLAALATSNSRHVPPAAAVAAAAATAPPSATPTLPTPTTLPRWNYALPAAALRPLWSWAEEQAGRHGLDDVSQARAVLREMDRRAAAEGGEAAARVWALLPPRPPEEEGLRRRAKL